jgi:curli biogenesis system outer membrane secretion channel CsgG
MTRLTRTALVALAGAGLVAPRAAVAQAAKPTVAIMYFNNNVITKDARDYDGLSKGLPDFLITEMSSNSAIRVVERDQVQKLLDEQKLVGAGQVDRESAVRVG